ncbi:LytTR family DNA-binding domain-containing protein [Rhizobacter sp. OV335]|uniref:LytR/AlgR family response regulator transcription factor n=1 Tax=Rhizobacter sp. OV335 TaxID=1500264 RepID=UPI000922D8BE|nr:LytTR family DNA-binding domain-containing protein [Rhizobacter sp. OV335]SHN38582.1 two component transcriptional regulator, LytTR family [Rhizobacter sp. OV335]
MPTALLADDEPVLLDELRSLLAEAWPELQIVATAGTGSQARRLLDEHTPDIAFLDVRMPGIDGLSVAALAPARTRVVFVTAHAEHALQAFEHEAADYLQKPVTPARLARTVQRLRRSPAAQAPAEARLRFLHAWSGLTMRVIEVDEVAVLRSDLRHTQAIARDGTVLLLRTPLAELLPQLDDAVFWPIHRGIVINARCIERVERGDDGELVVRQHGLAVPLPVSRSQRGRFRGM